MQHRVVFRGVVMLVALLQVAVARGAGPATVPAGPGDPPGSGRVGKFGDLRTLPVEGAKVIPADVVRWTLLHDWATQVALAPSAPVEQFTATIVERARDAYLSSGFSSPRVGMRFDEAKNPVALVVEEGKRYRRGAVRIVGATKIPVAEVVAELTRPPAPPPTRTPFKVDLNVDAATARIDGFDDKASEASAKAFWSSDAWVSFHPNWQAFAEGRVRRALAGRGFFQAKFTVEIVAGDADESELIVRVSDEGRPARLSGIDLSGLKRNSPEAVLAVMGLKENEPIDLAAMLAAQQALWDSGRFKKHAMRLQQDNEGQERGNARLKLDLDEHPTLPLLGEALSAEQQAMLRFGRWMEGFDERGDELVAKFRGAGLAGELILAARGQWLAHARENAGGNADTAPPAPATATADTAAAATTTSSATGPAPATPFDYAITATDERLTLFDPAQRRRAEFGAATHVVVPSVLVYTVPIFEQPQGRWQTFSAGGGVARRELQGGGSSAGPSLRFVLAPVILLAVGEPEEGSGAAPATRASARPALRDGIVSVQLGKYGMLRIDAETGALRGATFDEQGVGVELAVAPAGRMAAALGALDARAVESVRVGEEASLRPTIEIVAGLAASLPLSEPSRAQLRPLARLTEASSPLAVLLGPVIGNVTGPIRQQFSRASTQPDLYFAMAPPKLDPAATNPLFLAGTFGAAVADVSAPRGSWAWTVLRESFLLKSGEFRSAGREMERLQREKRVGPVAALAVAVSPLAGRNTAANFAKQALGMPEPAALVEDLRFLVDGQTPLSRGVLESAERLRGMSDAEVRAIAAALPPRTGRAFEGVAAQLKRRKADPVDRVLLDAVAALWPTHLRDPVSLTLERVALPRR